MLGEAHELYLGMGVAGGVSRRWESVSEIAHEELWLVGSGLTSVTAAIQLRVSHPFGTQPSS
jgi:hypothetical protein